MMESAFFEIKRHSILSLSIVIVIVFGSLVLCGITGSSLGWLKNYPGMEDLVELQGEKKLLGTYRGIRSDEFLAHGTPNALAQYNAYPRFPKLNCNNGISGRDLRILHDTGAPVWHFSSFARPAVWGFFVLDLRRALSWYWWFPVFGGLSALWWFLNVLFPRQSWINLLLSASLIFSPYCAAWSFWPAGNIGGFCLASAAFLSLSEKAKVWKNLFFAFLLLWGTLCGISTFYFPRIYPVVFLLAMVILTKLLMEHRLKNYLRAPLVCFVAGALLGIFLFLAGWFYDSREAISILNATSYPGMRRLSGGTLELWSIVQGWLAPLTEYKTNYSNQCELQGPMTMIFPLLLCFFYYRKRLWESAFVPVCLFAIVFIYWYQVIGFPDFFAKLTFWDRCNPPRCKIALILAQTLLLGFLFWRRDAVSESEEPIRRHTALPALCCFFPIVLLLLFSPHELWTGLLSVYSPLFILVVLSVMAFLYWLLSLLLLRYSVKFIYLFLAMNLVLGLVFNPVCIAPLKIVNRLPEQVREHPQPLHYGGRVLITGEKNFLALAVFAAGGKVLNSYCQYPDPVLHRIFTQGIAQPEQFFKMVNYDMGILPGIAPLKTMRDIGCERVGVYLNGEKFDFSKIPVDFVTASKADAVFLRKNHSLLLFHEGKVLDFYQVCHSDTSSSLN